jgi:hypothetical protein
MTHKLKMLGMALVAVLALTAVSASAASAANYTSSVYPTTGTGESALGNDLFTTEAGTVECKSHFQGTLAATNTDLTITPTYTSCKAFGFLSATVTGCKYTFTEPTGSADSYSAKVDVTSTCTIVASTCEVSVPTQGPLSSVAITNDTAAGDVTVKANVSNIGYTVVKDGIGCPFLTPNGTPEAKTGATYKQGTAITFDAVSPSTATIDVG